MWGYLSTVSQQFGYEEKKPEEEEEDHRVIDATDYQSVARAKLVTQGVDLPPLSELYAKDKDKEEQITGFVQNYSLLLEYQRAYELLPSGMYVSPSAHSVLQWHGVMFLRSGPYRGGVFKFQIDFPEEYPDLPPSIAFISDVFHPLVEQGSGRVDLENWFVDWRPNSDYAACALPRLHNVFARKDQILGPNNSIDALNPEARDLFLNDSAKFAERVKECVDLSNSDDARFKNPEGSLVSFAETPVETHDALLAALRETGTIPCSLDDRKCMYVEWFCDYFVRNKILKPKKKRKKMKDIGGKERRPTMKDTDALRKFATAMSKEDGDEDDSDDDDDDSGS